MNLLGASILCAAMIVILTASRRVALLGMMGGILYLTQGQQLQIAGFNMYAVRFLEMAGFFRVISRQEFSFSNLLKIDRVFLALNIATTVIFLLRSPDGQVYQIGTAVDAILCYFAFRGLVGGVADFKWFLKAFLILLAPYTAIVLVESFSHYNAFSSMGGIDYGNWIRNGRPRCQGSFRHPSLLGTFAATFIVSYIGLFLTKAGKKTAFFGISLCLAIVWATNSGGPLNCVATGIAGWLLWRFRTKMNLFRRGLALLCFALSLVMKSPIWYLPAKASSLSGGDGWHRSYLMDVAFQNLDKWWLAGMPIHETQGWFPYELETTGGADITNLFLSYGITAGLFSMILFIYLLVCVFSQLGKAMAGIRQREIETSDTEFLIWGLGCVLGVHLVNWLGITYFDQTNMIWFMQLAFMVNIAHEQLLPKRVSKRHTIAEPESAPLHDPV